MGLSNTVGHTVKTETVKLGSSTHELHGVCRGICLFLFLTCEESWEYQNDNFENPVCERLKAKE